MNDEFICLFMFNEKQCKGKGKGKGEAHPRAGHEGPEE